MTSLKICTESMILIIKLKLETGLWASASNAELWWVFYTLILGSDFVIIAELPRNLIGIQSGIKRWSTLKIYMLLY